MPRAGGAIHSANASAALWTHTLSWAMCMIIGCQAPGPNIQVCPQSVAYETHRTGGLIPLHRDSGFKAMDEALRAMPHPGSFSCSSVPPTPTLVFPLPLAAGIFVSLAYCCVPSAYWPGSLEKAT